MLLHNNEQEKNFCPGGLIKVKNYYEKNLKFLIIKIKQ